MKLLTRSNVVVILLATVFVVLFAPLRGTAELSLEPSFASWLENGGSGQPDAASLTFLTVPSSLVVTDAKGVYRSFTAQGHISHGKTQYISWDDRHTALQVRGGDGQIVQEVNSIGFPVFFENSLFLVSRTGDTLSSFGNDNQFRWQFAAGDLLTHLAVLKDERTVLQTLGGDLIVVSQTGKELFRAHPAGSRSQVGLGLCTGSSNTLYGVFGIAPQMLIAYQLVKGKDGLTEKWRMDIGSDFRRDVFIQPLWNGERVAVESNDGILVVNRSGRVEARIPIEDTITKIFDDGGRHPWFFVLHDGPNGSMLDAYTSVGQKVFSIGPSGKVHDAAWSGDRTIVMVGADGLRGYKVAER